MFSDLSLIDFAAGDSELPESDCRDISSDLKFWDDGDDGG